LAVSSFFAVSVVRPFLQYIFGGIVRGCRLMTLTISKGLWSSYMRLLQHADSIASISLRPFVVSLYDFKRFGTNAITGGLGH
jgi:hypothetical protein